MAITIGQTGNVNGSTLGFTAVAGRIIVCFISCRAGGAAVTGTSGTTVWGNNSTNNSNIRGIVKVAAGGETTVVASASTSPVTASFEVIGGTLTGFVSGTNQAADTNNPHVNPSVTPTGSSSCIVVGGGMQDAGNTTLTNNTGGTWGSSTGIGGAVGPADWPHTLAMYKIIASASGSYAPQFNNGNGWRLGCTGLIYEGAAAGGGPRAWVPAIVGMAAPVRERLIFPGVDLASRLVRPADTLLRAA